ncbi:transposase [Legionella pneumophila serogroup 1]
MGEHPGINDHLIELTKPKRKPQWMTEDEYKKYPDSLQIREVKVGNKVLITNQISPGDVSKADLKALYKKRWNIEVDLRNIKNTLGMSVLRRKTPAMNEKEIWVYFLAYNLIRLLMAQAALHAHLLPRQLSFKHSLQLCMAFSNRHYSNDIEVKKSSLLVLITQLKIGTRPGRIEPLAVKQRPKPYPLLMKIRPVAQEEIRQNGHPKKLK